MASSRTCDVCGQKTDNVVAKLLLLPVKDSEKWNRRDYTAHADVGACCGEKILKGELVTWNKRQKRPKAA